MSIESAQIDDFLSYLEGLRKKVQQSNGTEVRRCSKFLGVTTPPIGKLEIVGMVDQLIDYIKTHEFVKNDELDKALSTYKELFTEWAGTLLSNLYKPPSAQSVVFNFLVIFNGIKSVLRSYDKGLLTKNLQNEVKKSIRQLTDLQNRLERSEQSAGDVEEAIQKIMKADEVADRLPDTLVSLETAQINILKIHDDVQQAGNAIMDVKAKAETQKEFIDGAQEQIKELLQKSKAVLATATSSGLAGAFYQRKNELQKIGWIWTGGLVIALIVAIVVICWRADKLFALLDKTNDVSTFLLAANFLISMGFIGAPIWLAWVSTKQIGYYFRLSEDYAFKASVSASYEGFMEEARKHGSEFEKKVLESTIERYDEAPLRFVDSHVSGSPYHELLDSPEFRNATKKIPDFKDSFFTAVKGCLKKGKETQNAESISNKTE